MGSGRDGKREFMRRQEKLLHEEPGLDQDDDGAGAMSDKRARRKKKPGCGEPGSEQKKNV